MRLKANSKRLRIFMSHYLEGIVAGLLSEIVLTSMILWVSDM